MRQMMGQKPSLPLPVAKTICYVITRYLEQHNVLNAQDLPEEAMVELYRELQTAFRVDLPEEWLMEEEAARISWIHWLAYKVRCVVGHLLPKAQIPVPQFVE